MWKETIIISIIIVAILLGNLATRGYTQKSVEEMNQDLEALRIEMGKKEKNEETLSKEIEETFHKWTDFNEELSYYIEHDELEKVQTELVSVKANIETKEYENGIESIDKAKYLLEHIQEKEALNIKNIF
ncbi:MAG: DUF4363 family protein [Clostridia bacterium]